MVVRRGKQRLSQSQRPIPGTTTAVWDMDTVTDTVLDTEDMDMLDTMDTDIPTPTDTMDLDMVHVMWPTPVVLPISWPREAQMPNQRLMPRLIQRLIPGITTADSDMDTDTDWDTTDMPDISDTGATMDTADTTDIPTLTDTDWDTTDTTANKTLVQRGTTTMMYLLPK